MNFGDSMPPFWSISACFHRGYNVLYATCSVNVLRIF